MAYIPRSISQIQTQLVQQLSDYPLLSPLLPNKSKVAKFTNWTFIIAFCINALEQIWAVLQNDIETTVANSVPGTAPWIQSEILKFQEGDTVQVNTDFTISYPTENLVKRIITSAAVVITPSGGIIAKVAKGSYPYSVLSAGQITELSAYLASVLPAGQVPTIRSVAADTLQLNATIYYNGQSNEVISANVISALQIYMSLVEFNGVVKISDIEKIILGVSGVTDVTFQQITMTPTTGSPTDLVLTSTVLLRNYQTYAGYLVNAAATNDFANTLTFIVANS